MSKFGVMKKAGVFLLVTILSTPCYAFSDGSGYAILSKMVVLVNNATEQLKTIKQSLNISKYLEEIEQLNEAKSVVDGAEQLQAMLGELEEVYDIGASFTDFEKSYDRLQSDLTEIRSQYKQAKNLEGVDKINQYLRTLDQLKRLELLKTSHRQNLKTLSRGLNDREATRATAHSTAMTTELLIRMEDRQLQQQSQQDEAALEENAVQQSLSSGYRALGKLYE